MKFALIIQFSLLFIIHTYVAMASRCNNLRECKNIFKDIVGAIDRLNRLEQEIGIESCDWTLTEKGITRLWTIMHQQTAEGA
ncbi:hypothetical protein FRC02_007073, partial [Tulasnella sp. 418]